MQVYTEQEHAEQRATLRRDSRAPRDTRATNGMEEDDQRGRLNCFALVSYLPEPLRGYLDRLRCDLVPECHAKAHVTVLPPRPLAVSAEQAGSELSHALGDFPPFEVELGAISIFPDTQVIFIELARGAGELRRMHAALNAGAVQFREPFPYHPHITLAQQIEDPALVAAAFGTAERRWREFAGERTFEVRRLAFVQNSVGNFWRDLQQYDLAASPENAAR